MWLLPAWIRPVKHWRCPFRKKPVWIWTIWQSCRANPRRNWKKSLPGWSTGIFAVRRTRRTSCLLWRIYAAILLSRRMSTFTGKCAKSCGWQKHSWKWPLTIRRKPPAGMWRLWRPSSPRTWALVKLGCALARTGCPSRCTSNSWWSCSPPITMCGTVSKSCAPKPPANGASGRKTPTAAM